MCIFPCESLCSWVCLLTFSMASVSSKRPGIQIGASWNSDWHEGWFVSAKRWGLEVEGRKKGFLLGSDTVHKTGGRTR